MTECDMFYFNWFLGLDIYVQALIYYDFKRNRNAQTKFGKGLSRTQEEKLNVQRNR